MSTTEDPLQQLCDHVRQTAMLEAVNELLNWDERTYLPERGGEYRAEQITLLSSMLHQRRTDARLGELLDRLADDPRLGDTHSDPATIVRHVRRDYVKQKKLPPRLVEELTRCSVLGQRAWVDARETKEFARLAPLLEQIVALKREQAAVTGESNEPYDALLDDFEPDAKTEDVARTLANLKEALIPLVQAIGASGVKSAPDRLKANYPQATQENFGMAVAAALGFDFRRGRLDITHHPFCTELGPHDCRITTRYDEEYFPSGFFGILHEAGHGMYEQGRRADQYGLPTGRYVSLGIHESQSRLWENQVGRNHSFWQFFYPQAQQVFGGRLASVSLDDFYRAINDVRPSPIRVEADEATYNLHIIIRFELERLLISDELCVSDLPEAWNAKYLEYLGIQPADDVQGVLQDIHWPAALMGYFPTYTLGNLYAAQLYAQADLDLGGVDEQMSRGQFQPLLEWMQANVHRAGQAYTPAELVLRATGKPLSHEPLMRHLRERLEPLYGLA